MPTVASLLREHNRMGGCLVEVEAGCFMMSQWAPVGPVPLSDAAVVVEAAAARSEEALEAVWGRPGVGVLVGERSLRAGAAVVQLGVSKDGWCVVACLRSVVRCTNFRRHRRHYVS